jgi:hypothetical protein
MRALTLTQPYAGLVASGIKHVENRPKRMIREQDFGVPFAIHASREIREDYLYKVTLDAPDLFDPDGSYKNSRWYAATQIVSAIVGIATVDCVLEARSAKPEVIDRIRSTVAPEQRRWCFGPIIYVLRDIQLLEVPIPCRGYQSFWVLPSNIEEALVKQRRGDFWEDALYPTWRCAACDRRWRPIPTSKAKHCDICASEDVFPFETVADLKEWEDSAREQRNSRHAAEMRELSYGDD